MFVTPERWIQSPGVGAESDYEDLAYPPNGGSLKLLVLGIIVPGTVAYFGYQAWASQEAWWPGRGGGVMVHGEAAQAMAAAYLSMAAFIHFRWFWGLLRAERTFQAGTVLSLFSFLIALIWALCAS